MINLMIKGCNVLQINVDEMICRCAGSKTEVDDLMQVRLA
jgi:hypothetical protein